VKSNFLISVPTYLQQILQSHWQTGPRNLPISVSVLGPPFETLLFRALTSSTDYLSLRAVSQHTF